MPHYELHGPDQGLRVMLFLPLFTTAEDFKTLPPSQEFFMRLASTFRVLTFDYPGFGNSDPLEGHAPTMKVHAQIALTVLDAVGWSSCSLLGPSFGGMVALETAIARPTIVHRLILVATGPSVGPGPDQIYPIHWLLDGVEGAHFNVERGSLPLFARMLPRLLDIRRSKRWRDASELGRALTSKLTNTILLATAEDPSGRSRQWQMAARATFDMRGEARRLFALHGVRTLIYAGIFDAVSPPKSVMALEEELPIGNLTQVVWCTGGHWPAISLVEVAPQVVLSDVIERFMTDGSVDPWTQQLLFKPEASIQDDDIQRAVLAIEREEDSTGAIAARRRACCAPVLDHTDYSGVGSGHRTPELAAAIVFAVVTAALALYAAWRRIASGGGGVAALGARKALEARKQSLSSRPRRTPPVL